jgi:hypothetical protein
VAGDDNLSGAFELMVIKLFSMSFAFILDKHPIRTSYSVNPVF